MFGVNENVCSGKFPIKKKKKKAEYTGLSSEVILVKDEKPNGRLAGFSALRNLRIS